MIVIHTQRRIIFNVDAFKKYRVDKEWTQSEYAEHLDTSMNVISYWETGRRTPLPSTISKISDITGIPLDILYVVNHETLGTKLTTMRLKQDISQVDMASNIGTSPENINRWEADKHVPSVYFVYKLAKELGLSMEDLITNKSGELIISDPYIENKE